MSIFNCPYTHIILETNPNKYNNEMSTVDSPFIKHMTLIRYNYPDCVLNLSFIVSDRDNIAPRFVSSINWPLLSFFGRSSPRAARPPSSALRRDTATYSDFINLS